MKLKFFGLLLSCLTLLACQPSATAQPTGPLLPELPSSTATLTPISTTSLTPTITSSPTRIPTQILEFPDLTPLPTISSDERLLFIKSLISQNQDCLLPCWMDITPGHTTVEETWNFLSTFATRLYVLDNTIVMMFEFTDNSIGLVPAYQTYPTLLIQFEFEENIISLIHPDFTAAADLYSLERVLDIYGRPDEIRMGVGGLTYWTSTIEVFYQDVGISLTYGARGIKHDNQVTFCFNEPPGGAKLWDSNLNLSYEDIYPEYHSARVVPLIDVIDISVDKFFDNNIETKDYCVKTTEEYIRYLLQRTK